jgi:phospholipase C
VIDPHHSFEGTYEQIHGVELTPDTPGPIGPGTEPAMNGFVSNYTREITANGLPGDGRLVLKCHAPETVPVISTLATQYCACTRWFSSLPGPTWPNRFYVHAATSRGLVSGGFDETLDASTPTIYDRLDAYNIAWRVYSGDFAQSWGIESLRNRLVKQLGTIIKPGSYRNLCNLGQFFSDLEQGTLPSYSFIEPHYMGTDYWPPTDQHPPHDVRFGEDLLRRVYNGVVSSRYWEQSLLVVLYDEHGGLYDHVPPPSTVNPDGRNCTDPKFNFERLGVRVPAILISPFIDPAVDSTIYDHSSVPATLNKIFGLGPQNFLSKRDRQANTFESRLSRSSPRSRPIPLPGLPMDAFSQPASTGYSEYQLSLLKASAGAVQRTTGLKVHLDGRVS